MSLFGSRCKHAPWLVVQLDSWSVTQQSRLIWTTRFGRTTTSLRVPTTAQTLVSQHLVILRRSEALENTFLLIEYWELRFADGGKQIDFIALSMSQSSGRCESVARHDVSFRSFSSGRSQTTPSARSPAQKTHAYHPLETGNQMTSGTMRYDSPRHFGKTGRPSPDCTGWFMSTQNLRWILTSTKSWNRLSNIRRNTSDLETKRKLGRATWRARREAKRQRIQRELEDACRNKRCPHTHVEVCISIGRRRLGRTGNALNNFPNPKLCFVTLLL